MLASETPQVQLAAAKALGDMARCVGETKARICRLPTIMPLLTRIMNQGVLEAITAVHHLCAENETACDQAADAGAVPILAGFIHVDDGGGAGGGDGKNSDADSNFEGGEANAKPGTAAAPAKRAGGVGGVGGVGGKRGSSSSSPPGRGGSLRQDELTGTHSLAELRGEKLTEAFVQLGAGVDDRPNAEGASRAAVIPIVIKKQVVATLRSIATSSDRNLEALTRENRVIPHLVKLMTKMQDAEDGKSGTSGKSGGSADKRSATSDHSHESGGSDGERKEGAKGRKQRLAEALDRKKLAEENRKLAESVSCQRPRPDDSNALPSSSRI